MASEEGVPAAAADTAAIAEELAARTKDLVRRFLRPGGPLDVEVAANEAAEGARLYVVTMSRVHPVRREDIEAAAFGGAAGFLSVIARSNVRLLPPSLSLSLTPAIFWSSSYFTFVSETEVGQIDPQNEYSPICGIVWFTQNSTDQSVPPGIATLVRRA